MKTCEICGEEFKPRGRQRVCVECKRVQETLQETDAEETEPQRPLDRWGSNKVIFPGQARIIRR